MEAVRAHLSSEVIRVYVIESQVLLAKAICGIFAGEPLMQVAGDSRTLEPLALASADPSVILIDADHDLAAMPLFIERCRKAAPHSRVCVLSEHLIDEVMARALSAGADGYIIKDITPRELVMHVKQVASDGFYADERLSLRALRSQVRGDCAKLSDRELEVARLIAQGLSNQEIGDRLMLSNHTVKNHVANIFSKLNLTARTQVAIYAIRCGWV
jgi:DNA-binding NarL/FixJ family response regulator